MNLVLMALLFASFSCKKDEMADPFFIRLETEQGEIIELLPVTADGLSKSFNVKSNGSWKISKSDNNISWITINPDTGNKDGSFNLFIEANPNIEKRTEKLSCMIDGEELAVLQIEQAGRYPDFHVTPTSPEKIPGKGGEIEFTITSDVEWDYAIVEANWLIEKSKSSNN